MSVVNFAKSLLGGCVGGVLGAAVWIAAVVFLKIEIGWLAVLIGGAAGMGTLLLVRSDASAATGVVACGGGLFGLACAKYLSAWILVGMTGYGLPTEMTVERDKEVLITYVADGVVEEWEAAGRTVEWKDGVDPNHAWKRSDYPTNIWTEATDRWNAMTPEERREFAESVNAFNRSQISRWRPSIAFEFMRMNLGLFEALWVVLVVVTAFPMGSGRWGGWGE